VVEKYQSGKIKKESKINKVKKTESHPSKNHKEMHIQIDHAAGKKVRYVESLPG